MLSFKLKGFIKIYFGQIILKLEFGNLLFINFKRINNRKNAKFHTFIYL
jgi:hypothetical protein